MDKKEMLVFETNYLRYVVSRNGYNLSVVDKGSGVDYCRLPGRYPFVSFGTQPPGAPTQVTRKENFLHIKFNKEDTFAVIEITKNPNYLVFELKELQGVNTPVFNLASVGLAVTEHIGKMLNIVWSPTYAICLLGLTMNTETTCNTYHEPIVTRPVLHIRTHETLGHVGCKYAMVGAPRTEIENIIYEVARDHGIPTPCDEHGVPMKKSYRSQRSYLFLGHLGKQYEDFALKVAKKGGFGLVMGDKYWSFESSGSYNFRKSHWPNGIDDIIAWTNRCHKEGLMTGFHSLSCCVDGNDPLVLEGVRNGFVPDGGNILAEDVSAKADTFSVILPPYGELGKGIFRIEDELIRIGGTFSIGKIAEVWNPASSALPMEKQGHYVLASVKRGVNGTTPTLHKKGTPLMHFRTCYGFSPDPNGPIAEKVIGRLAEIMNRCDFDKIFLDGLEGTHDPTMRWHDAAKISYDLFNRLERKNVIIEASMRPHFSWHILTRANSGDAAPGFGETSIEHVRAKEYFWMRENFNSFLPPIYGWHGWNAYNSDMPCGILLMPTPATTLNDWAVYLEAARRLDLPLGVLAGVYDLQNNPDTEKMLKMTREYEEERIKRLFGVKV
jgi:hypothetical protein